MSTHAGRGARGARGRRGRGRGGNASLSEAQAANIPAPAQGSPDAPAATATGITLELLFGNLPQDLQPRLKDWAEGVEEAHRETTTRPRDVAPSPTKQEYNALIELVDDDPLWTAQDTARLNEDCAQLEQVINTPERNTHMQSLWKLTPKFMGCVPISIICPERLLEYGSEHPAIPVGNYMVIHPNWSSRFCDHLRFLVVHPIFSRSPGLLALAIQYAVKCRTNDRRRWPIQDPTGDRYINLLASAFRDGHGQTRTEDIHRDVRQQMEVLPPLCRLLREIERVSIPTQLPEAVVDDDEPFAAYTVTTSDVHNIKKAVDRVAKCGMPDYLPADLRLMWTTSATHGHSYPPATRLKEILLQACKRQVQEAELRRRRPAQAAQQPMQAAHVQPAEATPAEETARQLEQATATIARLQEELRQAPLVDPQFIEPNNTALLQRATAAEEKLARVERQLAEIKANEEQLRTQVAEAETQIASTEREQQLNARVAELKKQLAEKTQVERKFVDAEARASAAEQKLAENQVAFISLRKNLSQIEQNARAREQELSAQLAQVEARASAAEDRLTEARINEEALRIRAAHAEERALAAGLEQAQAGPSSESDIVRMALMMGVELATERAPPAIPAGMPANATPPNSSIEEQVSRAVDAGIQRWLQERLRVEQKQRLEQEGYDIEAQEQLRLEAMEQQARSQEEEG